MTSKEIDFVHNVFINDFDKNILPVFLSLKFANNQFLSLQDSTISSPVSKIQALALAIKKSFFRVNMTTNYNRPHPFRCIINKLRVLQ